VDPRHFLPLLDSVDRHGFTGELFRHFVPSYEPLSGDGARRHGGRWNPPDSFPAVYTGLSIETVEAEFHRLAANAGLPAAAFLPRDLVTIRATLDQVLDIREPEVMRLIGVSASDLVGPDVSIARAIGEAANLLGFEAILAPSATGRGDVCVLLLMNRSSRSAIEVVDRRPYEP
jgi:RES domain-containing protein